MFTNKGNDDEYLKFKWNQTYLELQMYFDPNVLIYKKKQSIFRSTSLI